ncbi:MAG: AsmA family protein [Bacteroidales bacterium]|nr:AsmA family protein [Bacteroidales bacterium]
MKKFLKITAIVLVILVAVIILIPIIFKGKIIEMAKEEANNNLNAKVEFVDFNLSLIKNFPNISAELEGLSIVGIDTFATDTLVKFKKFKATLDFISVISGNEIKVKRIFLDEPVINIKVLQNGTANYDIAKEDTSSISDETTNDETGDSNFKINLKKFEIKNGNIIYDDKESDIYAKMENLNFILSGDMTEDITNLDINMLIDSLTVKSEGIKYLNKVKTKFDSELKADLENSIYTFKENELKLNEITLGFDGFVEMPEEDIIMDLTFNTKESKFKDALSMVPAVYKSDFEDVTTSGEFKMDGYAKGTYNDTLMPAYGVNILIKNAYFKYPDLPKSVENINVNMKVDAKEGSGDDMTINIKKASMTMAKNPINISAFIHMTAEDVGMSGKIKGKVDLNSVKDVIPADNMDLTGIITADISFKGNLSDIENENYEKFDAKGNFGIQKMNVNMSDMPKINIQKADMNFSPQFVYLKQFDAKIGKSDLRLSGKVNNLFSYVFKDELLSGTFSFNSDFIDVDELMNVGSSDSESGTEDGTSSESEVVEIPGNLDFTLNSSLKKIVYDKLTITNAVGKIIIKDSKLDMQQLKMDMLGGSMTMNGSYDTKNISKPFADFNMSINNFNIAETSKAFLSIKRFAPVIENCTGDISANISLQSILDNEMMPVLKSLMSTGDLSSGNLSIRNNKLFEKLANRTKQNKFKSPRLNNLDLSYFIDNGNLTVKPSKFKIGDSEIKFGGTQNIDKGLNFDIGMVLPKGIAGGLIDKFSTKSSKENVGVNARIGGTADEPKIVGFTSAITEGAFEQVEEVKNEVKEKATKIIEEARIRADKIIKVAENQANTIRAKADNAGKKLISEAENQGNKLIKQAKNPISKKAAEVSKKKLVDQAKKQANNLNSSADKQARSIINSAKNKADKIVNDAKKRAGN